MKKTLTYLLLLYLTPNLGAQIYSAQEPSKNRVVAKGQVELISKADLASFSFTVTSTGEDFNDALEQSKKKVKHMTSALMEHGLDEKDFSTSRFFSAENFGDKAFLSSSSDFKAEISVSVTLTDFERLEPVLIHLYSLKPTSISDIQFTKQNLDSIKTLALVKATKKAREKARIMADLMNSDLGETLYLEEVLSYDRTATNNVVTKIAKHRLSRVDSKAIFSPDVRVTVTVQAIIALVPKK